METRYDFFRSRIVLLIFLLGITVSCEDFLEVGIPDTQLAGPTVFESTTTANAALASIYSKLRDGVLVTGSGQGLSVLLGQYSDELDSYSEGSTEHQFYQSTLLPSNINVAALWRDSYNLIYACNAVIEGVSGSPDIPQPDKDQLYAEALFVRSFIHFHLLQLFGDIPFVTGTDYRVNAAIGKLPAAALYELVLQDLFTAAALLSESYKDPERIRPVKAVASALIARIQLYRQDWAEAEASASAVIGTADYVWVDNLDEVFLKGSTGTLWQLAPATQGIPTTEGASFILTGNPANRALSNALAAAFEPGDLRRTSWIGEFTNQNGTWFYPFKYKQRVIEASSSEYSILFRLEEMYLIRAEARVRQGDLEGAREDLDRIRLRAGLQVSAVATGEELLQAIYRERRVELFAENGHRWFDLKRTGQLQAALESKQGWEATDELWPLPEQELLLNPNILPQNEGY